MPNPPSFSFGARVELVVRQYRRALLCIPALASGARLDEKDLLGQGPAATEAKFSLDEHLEYLVNQGVITGDRPLLAFGMRNSLVNLRCPVILDGRSHAVAGEDPQRSRRPYYGIGARDGRLVMGQALGDSQEDWSAADFFCAAVPVLDERLDQPALLDAILTEAADHSHVFDLPRGNHPLATDATRAAWAQLHDAFTANLYTDRPQAAAAMRAALAGLDPAPSRCADYLHAVLGVSAAGELVCVFAHGLLEAVGRRAGLLGAERAVCVENSGSIMPTFLPEGADGERIPLLRAPNFRPKGRALLVIELTTGGFESLAGVVSGVV
ncbi:hypothetical protein [uncultured Thiodictyon sp.]|jgi:hypothetical protein|uniref:hypothetical protein n=1 Tax=uncultured Thiodictyon sp. TaxID=1846217 RepID=UPI0025EDB07D|nr:hypothetical protein [uncultured Thiodictyon sp.]